MLEIVFLFLHLGLFVFLLFLCIAFVTGAPYVPSSNPVSTAMIELAHIKPGMTVYDLGSGDGKLLFLAAKKGARAIGYEINPWLVLFTYIRTLLTKSVGVRAVWKNFWGATYLNADVLFIYLLPWRMEKLQAYLKNRVKPGTLIVSNSFIFPNWPILRQDEKLHVYAFRVE